MRDRRFASSPYLLEDNVMYYSEPYSHVYKGHTLGPAIRQYTINHIQYPTKIPAPIIILQLKTWFLALCCNTNLIGINLERKYLIQCSFLVRDLKPELELCTISIFISSQSWLLPVHRPPPYIMQPLPCIWPYKIKCLDFDQIYLAIASQSFYESLQGPKFDVKVESTAYL